MKYEMKKAVCFTLLLCLIPLSSLAKGAGFRLRFDRKEHWVDESRHVVYPQLEADDPALSPRVSKVNQAIRDTARIQEYVNLLSTVQPGGTGLTVEDSLSIDSPSLYRKGTGYFYLLMEAEGKMLQGPPSRVYYPMLFDLSTGDRVSFDALFTDVDGAKAYIENYLAQVVEPQLSTYLENNQLFPVPYDSFGFSQDGHIILYYPGNQLSFLSGAPGAIAFRYSELWDYLDTSENSIALQMAQSGGQERQYSANRDVAALREWITEVCCLGALPGLDHQMPVLGTSMDLVAQRYDITIDSGYYPGGAYVETEKPELLGSYLLTDEAQSYVSGILTGRVDLYGIETGKTTLEEAKRLLGAPTAELPLSETAAEMYLVCPGTMITYSFAPSFAIAKGETGQESAALSLALYADESGIVQYIKLSLE